MELKTDPLTHPPGKAISTKLSHFCFSYKITRLNMSGVSVFFNSHLSSILKQGKMHEKQMKILIPFQWFHSVPYLSLHFFYMTNNLQNSSFLAAIKAIINPSLFRVYYLYSWRSDWLFSKEYVTLISENNFNEKKVF